MKQIKVNKLFFFSYILIFLFVFFYTSCGNNADCSNSGNNQHENCNISPSISVNVGEIGVVCFNQNASIVYDVSNELQNIRFKWFEIRNGEHVEILGEEKNTFVTPLFYEKGIKTFYCKVIDVINEEEIFESEKTYIAYTGLPIVSISTDDNLDIDNRESWKNMKISLSEDNKTRIILSGKIKGRGNTSWYYPKKPYTIKLSEKENLLGMGECKKWVLINNYIDKSLLRNSFASYIGNTCFNSEWQPKFRSVDLVLNGSYRGTYILGESIKIEKNRINIQSLENTYKGKGLDLNNDDRVDICDGGFLCEINNKEDEDFNFSSTIGFPIISLKDPDLDFEEANVELKRYIRETVQEAEDTLYGNNWQNVELGYTNKFDINSFIDWYLVNEFLKNADSVSGPSIYFYYNPSDSKIHFGPNWDFDASCGQFKGWIPEYDVYNPEGFWVLGGYKIRGDKKVSTAWINRLFLDEDFVLKVKKRWNDRKNILYKAITDGLKELSDEIELSAELNFILYPVLGTKIMDGYEATGYNNRNKWIDEVDYLRNWLNERYTWFDKAINQL